MFLFAAAPISTPQQSFTNTRLQQSTLVQLLVCLPWPGDEQDRIRHEAWHKPQTPPKPDTIRHQAGNQEAWHKQTPPKLNHTNSDSGKQESGRNRYCSRKTLVCTKHVRYPWECEVRQSAKQTRKTSIPDYFHVDFTMRNCRPQALTHTEKIKNKKKTLSDRSKKSSPSSRPYDPLIRSFLRYASCSVNASPA